MFDTFNSRDSRQLYQPLPTVSRLGEEKKFHCICPIFYRILSASSSWHSEFVRSFDYQQKKKTKNFRSHWNFLKFPKYEKRTCTSLIFKNSHSHDRTWAGPKIRQPITSEIWKRKICFYIFHMRNWRALDTVRVPTLIEKRKKKQLKVDESLSVQVTEAYSICNCSVNFSVFSMNFLPKLVPVSTYELNADKYFMVKVPVGFRSTQKYENSEFQSFINKVAYGRKEYGTTIMHQSIRIFFLNFFQL